MRNGNYSPYSNGHTPNNGHGTFNSSGFSESLGDISLVHSPPVTPEVKNSQLHPKSLVERYVHMSIIVTDMKKDIHLFFLKKKYYY